MNEQVQEIDEVPKLVAELPRLISKHEGAIVTLDPMRNPQARVLQFPFTDPKARVTIRVLFDDYSGSDVVISHMTTLPNEVIGKGCGPIAVNLLVEWARESGFNEVRATQVKSHNVPFWKKCGFVPDEKATSTKDYVFKF